MEVYLGVNEVAAGGYHSFIVITNAPIGGGAKINESTIYEGISSAFAFSLGRNEGTNKADKYSGTLFGWLVKATDPESNKKKQDFLDNPDKYDGTLVEPPKGMSQGEFESKIESTFNSYDENVPYCLLPTITDMGNSNSLIGSILRALGSLFKPDKWVPGWDNDISENMKQQDSNAEDKNESN